jgi:predicted outer membrane repeat protein
MRSRTLAFVLGACAIEFAAGPAVPHAAANIIQVPSAHPTIQAGINAATTGDTVQVGPGTYTGAANRNLDFGGKNILLRSSAGAATTIIDCQNLARAIRFHTGEGPAAVVRGFTMRNGLASGTFGAGILIEGGATPTIRDCRFESNHANTGGAVYFTSAVTLTDCTFDNNGADNFGGGIYGETGTLAATRCSFTHNVAAIGAGVAVILDATATLTDCTFTENNPVNMAGGFYASASAVALDRCTFLRNTGKNGAGAYMTQGTAAVDSCTFSANTAGYSGGGMQADVVNSLSVTWCTFEGNTTESTSYPLGFGGGGLYIDNYHIPASQVVDCSFINNRTLGQSGATGGGLKASGYSPDHLILRCTFIDNYAVSAGGGASVSGRCQNCVFHGNTTGGTGGGLAGAYDVIDCRFTNNQAKDGGGCQHNSAVIRCEFTGNVATRFGGGLQRTGSIAPFTVEDCRFAGNQAPFGGGMWAFLVDSTSITGSTFDGNVAGQGGAAYISSREDVPPLVEVSECTLVRNQSQAGGAFNLGIPVQIQNTIIAFGTQGEAVTCFNSGYGSTGLGVMSCTDIFGNAGGDWTTCIADQVGINGNFSLDPRFCNLGGGDFRLAQTSPCTAANAPAGCGLIGAYPIGCASPIGIADAGAPAVTPILRVTPNPMRGAGTIEWLGTAGEPELRLYDASGRLVVRHAASAEAGVGRLPWSALVGSKEIPSGVYFLRLGGDAENAATVRLVVIR